MTENEFLLEDRLAKIKAIIDEYGEDNFVISFSGGKDSTILSHLIDLALPNNKIPRVYINTGIEYKMMVDYVKGLQKLDDRIVIIQPSKNIQKVLQENGYPFKSKEHSLYVSVYQNIGNKSKTVERYLHPSEKRKAYGCRDDLKYQFTPEFKLKLSSKCCDKLKKEPFRKWCKENGRTINITGVRATERGLRGIKSKCTVFVNNKLKSFQPLSPIREDWINWFIDKYQIRLCDLYYEPYNFKRTGCKGCPFNPRLQDDLDLMEQLLPNEYTQCERIWKPVYEEYRKINYRLKRKKEEEID